MNIYETFDTPVMLDSPKEFPLSETAYVTLLPLTGEKSKRAYQKLLEPYSARLKAGNALTEAETKEINIRHFAETVIVSWRGWKGKNKEDVPFSKENAKALLTDPKLTNLFELLAKMASNEAAFAEEQAKEDEGNS